MPENLHMLGFHVKVSGASLGRNRSSSGRLKRWNVIMTGAGDALSDHR